MIPMVGFQQMVLIRIFLQDGRPLGGIVHASLITVVAAEAGRGIMVTAKTEVVHLEGIASQKDATSPVGPGPKVLGMRVRS